MSRASAQFPSLLFTALVCACASSGIAPEAADTRGSVSGKAVYTACGACHMPDGAGVAGAFPPLRNRIGEIAATPRGREYLIAVILDGLSGPITVGGVSYTGFMQPHRQSLGDEQISAVLNYVAAKLTEEPPADQPLFDAEQVRAIRILESRQSMSVRERRESLGID